MKKRNKLQTSMEYILRKIYSMITGLPSYDVEFRKPENVHIGKNVQIGPGVKIITRNHNIYDVTKYEKRKDVFIGSNSWIGANAVILPGVILGDNTIVGAGAVVTKSFKEGKCILVGVPAKKIRDL